MAHQAHNLPWQTLADHFKFVYQSRKYEGRTNLYPCFKPGQGKQLHHFARVFARVIDEFSASERKKYDEDLTPPTNDEIFISDTTKKRTAKTVRWYKTYNETYRYSISKGDLELIEERKASHWIQHLGEREINTSYPSIDVYNTVELLKTLILHGEMEPLLRLAVHPKVSLQPTWYFPWEMPQFGLADVKDSALLAYLCLNMLLLKPELYDNEMRSAKIKEIHMEHSSPLSEESFDYRLAGCYHKMMLQCLRTRYRKYEVGSLPHREFFGIDVDMIETPPRKQNAEELVGLVSPMELLHPKHRTRYIPSAIDVSTTLAIIKKIFPTELALQILEFADYTAKRRVPVPNDPLHKANREELTKYLSYCWKLLVRINILIKANGGFIPWEYEVEEAIFNLWGVKYPKMRTSNYDNSNLYEKQDDIEGSRYVQTFL
ncbi:hypothetical protein N0V90_005874 [Kalmusia sp. IMI 367209]|nr:hypothetical protein N0V90_005874 [Kalmusia sp. IMI 367209]